MSNRLTFSLASLFLIFGLVFATAPAMAQAINATLDLADTTADSGLTFTPAATAIPAGGYLIISKAAIPDPRGAADTENGIPALPSNVIHGVWGNMPDLEALFGEAGGTILLQASLTNVDPAGTLITSGNLGVGLRPAKTGFTAYRYDHDSDDDGFQPDGTTAVPSPAVANDGKVDHAAGTPGTGLDPTATATADATDPIDVRVDDLTITEIMWAINTANVGSGNEHNHQWIEIWNRNTKAAIPLAGLVLRLQSGRPALSDANTTLVETSGSEMPIRIALDRVSNVVGAGWVNDVGQNGFDDGSEGAAEVPFVSMYRKRGNDQIKKGTGSAKGHWVASTQVSYSNHKGTPGKAERAGTRTFTTTTIPRSPIIFNEISNRNKANRAYEWIELRNVSDGEANLKNWQISIVTSSTSDKEFFNFYDKDIKVPAGGILLLVASDPSENPDHPLAAGFNIEKGADNQANGVGAHSPRYLIMKKGKAGDNERGLKPMYVDDSETAGMGEGLPDDGMFVLILRNGHDKETKAEKLVDIAGYDTDTSVNSGTLFTDLWPLVNYPKPDITLNQLEVNKVHRRQHADIDGTRTKDKKDNADHVALRDVPWTGVGYKRNAAPTAAHGGTPGYPNGAIVSEGANATDPVIISEIMFDNTRNFSQWIELHNTSKTHGVNIDNWSIFIVNHNDTADDGEYQGKLSERIDLDGKIPPGQTYLIVSRRGSHDTKLPAARIHSANRKRTETILNPYGFQITLKAKTNEGDANKHQTVDMVGNLGAAPENTRRADAQSFEDLAWMLPDGTNDDDNRVSINRVPSQKAMMTDGGRIDGMMKQAWKRFDMTEQITLGNYYGHSSDIGSPGHTTGGVLPVSLSKFRPERMKDTGEIVIRWVTESELNNAGFNILRSEKRDGEFTKINTKLIAGQGTTSERTIYRYADTSAKPNVVYYYQIQDVSLDGNVTTLRTTHLRGNVTAAGKLTTTWGELKTLHE